MKNGKEIGISRRAAEGRVIEYLESDGYQVTAGARIRGKSGIEHTFDVLAQNDDGITKRVIAICIVMSGDKEAEASAVFNFANKAYDAGIKDRVLIAVPRVDPETKQLAEKQRIKVIDEEKRESLLSQMRQQKVKPAAKPFRFGTKAQLLESLTSMGYKVEENAKARGRSGVEYTFDILAYGNGSRIGHSLGIDIMSGEGEIGVDEVSLFDTKAYDTALDDKVIALLQVSLSPEAKQFVEHQGIKILELGEQPDKPVVEEKPVAEEEAKEPQEPVKLEVAEAPVVKSHKQLRQMPQPEALRLIPEVLARRYSAIPLTVSGNTLEVAMADPTDILGLEAFAVQSHMRIKPVAGDAKEIREAIDFNYKG